MPILPYHSFNLKGGIDDKATIRTIKLSSAWLCSKLNLNINIYRAINFAPSAFLAGT